jgi:hypothetical protein
MLNNAAKAAAAKAAGKNTAGLSKIQQMLAGREDASDTVSLSPVAKLLQSQKTTDAAKSTPYTEQDWYINAKVSQLKAQISIYSNLPGLDPSGAIMDALQKEAVDLAQKQQAKIAEQTKAADEAKAKLEEQEKAKALAAEIPDVDTLLKRAKSGASGEYVPSYASTQKTDTAKDAAVAAMLKKIGAKTI